jgi:hypothetical protein
MMMRHKPRVDYTGEMVYIASIAALHARMRDMRLAGVIVLVMILVCAGIAVGAFRSRWQAKELIEDVARLDASPDAAASFRGLREKYRHLLTVDECRNDACGSEFLVSNWILSGLRLAPRTELRARIFLFQGKVSGSSLEFTSAVFEHDNPIVHVQEDFCADRTDIRCDHFALNPHGRNVTPAWNGSVEFGQLATNEQKQAAWGINSDCLVAFRGCKDISTISRQIWRTSGSGVVSSCMRSSADSEAEASEPLSDACSTR